MAVCLLSAAPVAAQAEDPRRQQFVDWDYAVWVWTNLRTGEEFDREHDRVNPAYEAWKKKVGWVGYYATDPEKVRKVTGGDADLIRKGYDLEQTYEAWKVIYQAWWGGRGFSIAEQWNKTTRCGTIPFNNIFTGQCNDLPDWRTAEDVARDDQVLADYLARKARRDAKGKTAQ